MFTYILSRLWEAAIGLLIMTVVVFVLVRLTGDPTVTMLPMAATEEDRVRLRAELGLDRTWSEQYWNFMKSAVRGNFGLSVTSPGRSVMELVVSYGPNSLRLGFWAMVFAVFMGLPLGILGAVKRGRIPDFVARIIAALGQSAPMFWVGLTLMYFFAIRWHIFPVVGSEGFSSCVLPAITLGWFITAGLMRLVRSAMIDALESDYVTLARVKGVSETAVIWKHALRNALIPVVTFTGMYFTLLVSGVVVVEVVFAWPGLGLLLYRACLGRDFPVVQLMVLVLTAMVIIANLMVDILYVYIDPRIRYRKGA